MKVKNTKIYNEVIIDMNPLSPTYGEILYEDSELYSGDLALASSFPSVCESLDRDVVIMDGGGQIYSITNGSMMCIGKSFNIEYYQDTSGDGVSHTDPDNPWPCCISTLFGVPTEIIMTETYGTFGGAFPADLASFILFSTNFSGNPSFDSNIPYGMNCTFTSDGPNPCNTMYPGGGSGVECNCSGECGTPINYDDCGVCDGSNSGLSYNAPFNSVVQTYCEHIDASCGNNVDDCGIEHNCGSCSESTPDCVNGSCECSDGYDDCGICGGPGPNACGNCPDVDQACCTDTDACNYGHTDPCFYTLDCNDTCCDPAPSANEIETHPPCASVDACGNCTLSNNQPCSVNSDCGSGFCADVLGLTGYLTCQGDAWVDECGVCNGDSSSCEDECGVPNGDNACHDECGVPNGDNTTCADGCGVPNGDAGDSPECCQDSDCGSTISDGGVYETDQCTNYVCDCSGPVDCMNDCNGDGGLLTYCYDNDGDGLGWAGTETEFCSGDSGVWPQCTGAGCYVQNCDDTDDECASPNVRDCNMDCVAAGTGAYLDDCGVCSGGNSGHIADSDMDVCGICFGDGTWCADMCGDPDGPCLNIDNCPSDCSCCDACGVPNGTCWDNDCAAFPIPAATNNATENNECGDCAGTPSGDWQRIFCYVDEDDDGFGAGQAQQLCVPPEVNGCNDPNLSDYVGGDWSGNFSDIQPTCSTNDEDACGLCAGQNYTENCVGTGEDGLPIWNEAQCTLMDCKGRCPNDEGYGTNGTDGINNAGACEDWNYATDCQDEWCTWTNEEDGVEPSGGTARRFWQDNGVWEYIWDGCAKIDECGICGGSGATNDRLCYFDNNGDGFWDDIVEVAGVCLNITCAEHFENDNYYDDESGGSGQGIVGCTDLNACTGVNLGSANIQDNPSTCEYTSCCNEKGSTYTTGECICEGQYGISDDGVPIGAIRYCGSACEYNMDDCGDCVSGGSCVGPNDECLTHQTFDECEGDLINSCLWDSDEAGDVMFANQRLDHCNECGGQAWLGDEALYPDNYYKLCYDPNNTNDDPLTNGPGLNGGYFYCPNGVTNINNFQFDEMLFGTNGSYNVGSEPEGCEYHGLSDDVSYDAGCSDPSACNYMVGHEGCNAGGPGTELTDTACCIYPVNYCDSSNSAYSLDGVGSTNCCDVTGDGNIVSEVLYCDGVVPDGHIWGGATVYVGGTGSDFEVFGGNNASFQSQDSLVETFWVPVTNGTDILAGNNGACGLWDLSGCPDPVALNYESDTLYEASDSGAVDIYGQIGVTLCDYCLEGQTFYWETHYTPIDGNTSHGVFANIDSIADSVLNTIDGGTASTYLDLSGDDSTKRGACFSDNDMAVLQTFNLSRQAPGGTPSPYTIQMNHNQGYQQWNSDGRLIEFVANDARQGMSLNNLGITQLPTTIGTLDQLTLLDLGFNQITGMIPDEIGNATSLQKIYLNDNQFTGIFTFEGGAQGGLCDLVSNKGSVPGGAGTNSVPEYDTSDTWLYLMGNRICPTAVINTTTGVAEFPPCLVDESFNSAWITDNLGQSQNENLQTQYDFGVQDFLYEGTTCVLSGCMDPQAETYWPAATLDSGLCTFDLYLHFPYDPDTRKFGGSMSTVQMIQALHADIYGLKYNYWGSLDVTGASQVQFTQDDNPGQNLDDCYLNLAYNCNPSFDNTTADSNSVIDLYDGMWLRKFNIPNDECTPTVGDATKNCSGDARPLEFIERVLQEEAAGFTNASTIYFGTYFPTFGRDISMDGLEYFEDYDVSGNGQLDVEDINYWNSVGRYDVAFMIEQMMEGDMFQPPPTPEFVEFWATDADVQLGYSKDFTLEEIPSGQWKCSDEGDSSACYEAFDPTSPTINVCGIANDAQLDNIGIYCTPCGNSVLTINETTGIGTYSEGMGGAVAGRSDCIPLTMKTAKQGHHKILKDSTKTINYFSDGVSNGISGSDIYTSSLADSNTKYYYGITDGDPLSSRFDTQLYSSWGHIKGSGSYTSNNNIKGSSESVYKQYASMLLDDDLIETGFLISSGSDVTANGEDGGIDEWIYVLSFKQSRFEDQLQASTWTLQFSGSNANNPKTIHLTDNSLISVAPIMTDGGRRYDIISGSAGTPHTDYNRISGRYGFFYPDAGLMIFGEKLSNDLKTTTSPEVGIFASSNSGSNQLYPLTSSNSDAKNALRLVNCLRNVTGSALTVYGEKEVTDVTFACTVGTNDFNHTSNPTILSGSSFSMLSEQPSIRDSFNTAVTSSAFTGSAGQASSTVHGDSFNMTITGSDGEYIVWPGSNVSTMDGDPRSFITGVTLWDNTGTPVANATLSKPLQKSFDRELVIKVKLEF